MIKQNVSQNDVCWADDVTKEIDGVFPFTKMEVFLYNSTVCRLCGEENDNGTLLYSCEENNQLLSDIINAYLPIKVSDDGQLPRTICPGCTIQIEATVEFLNLIIKGQKIIRELHQREREYKKTLFNKEPDVITENIVYEVNTTDGVYQVEHPIALQVSGLDKPKRKRGRPPKKSKNPEELALENAAKVQEVTSARADAEEPTGKRRRKTPTRFKEAVQGKELDRIFKEEGVTDGEDSDNENKPDPDLEPKVHVPKEPEVIGHMEDSGELVVFVKGKGRGRPKGRMRQTREECAICGMEFSCVGRYMSHIAQHGPVVYQCVECSANFSTRLTFTAHQRETGHQGRNVIACSATTQPAMKTDIKVEPPEKQTQESPALATVDKHIDNVIATKGLPDLDPQPAADEPNTKDLTAISTNDKVDNVISDDIKPSQDNVNESGHSEAVSADPSALRPDELEKSATTGKPKLKCNFCDKTFSNKQSKSLHIKATHYGERPYSCAECGARFAYPRSLTLHAVSHRRSKHAAKGYACDLCGKVLNHPSSVVYHKEAEHAGQRYVCNKCGKSFKHKQLLQRHQLVHSQLRPYVCKTCNASFKTKANLINHQLLHSGVKKFSCEICKHKFAHKTSLTLHMRWHTGQKPFSCEICGKSFSQKGNLSEHERIHTGEKPYQCTLCPRRFTTSSQHRLHARRHAAERPYACTHCGKRFASRGSWMAHQRREAAAANVAGAPEEKRDHRCTTCGRAFAERWALVKHIRRHTGERPFRCPHCPRAFADCSNLNKHKKQVHKQISLLVNDKNQQPIAQQPSPAQELTVVETSTEGDLEERVIYVTYDVDEADSPAYHILDPDQAESLDEAKVLTTCELYPVPSMLLPQQQVLMPQPQQQVLMPQLQIQEEQELFQQINEDEIEELPESLVLDNTEHMPVTDEEGNPLHFTMQDGTRLAITSMDGKSLQVVTQDGQTIPVEINGFAEEEEEEEDSPHAVVHELNFEKIVETTGSTPVTHYFTIA